MKSTPQSRHIWIIDDDASIRWVLQRALNREGWSTRLFDCAQKAQQALENTQPDLVITDIHLPEMNGFEFTHFLHQHYPGIHVIIMTAFSDLDTAVSAYQEGAFEYLPKPFDIDETVRVIQRALEDSPSSSTPNKDVAPESPPVENIVGNSAAMQNIYKIIGRLARSHVSVLITGESGTGKELIAQAVHQHSPRANGPYIAINTAAIPSDLLESELFGHERGAFTGAHHQRIGRFEQANGGSLFLDEIGDMPAPLQTRLLRVLANGEFYRVGGQHPIKVDVRIIAATNKQLEQAVSEGRFREDLFHRLNVIRLKLPPLRDRTEDIPLLINHFLTQAAHDTKSPPKKASPELIQFLQEYHWPGNIRELQNVCHWLTVMGAATERIEIDDLPPALREKTPPATIDDPSGWESALERWIIDQIAEKDPVLNRLIPKIERLCIQAVLNHTHHHRQKAAQILGWGRNTLSRKIKELGLDTNLDQTSHENENECSSGRK